MRTPRLSLKLGVFARFRPQFPNHRFGRRAGLAMLGGLGLICVAGLTGPRVHGAVLKHSDVVFMYQADPQTYADYGATTLAWGGKPTPKSLEQAKGVKFFGSVGMVTEFARYYERFPETYQQGLCRDINGEPVKVPWLTDHQHKGVPFWWCCTQQPLFRQYIRERVVETVQAGADGVHIDDHMGTSGGLWLGICFCDRCVDGFRSYLKTLPAAELERLGIAHPETFNYRDAVKAWITEGENKQRKPAQHPLWERFSVYQCRAAAAFMQELRELAASTAGHPVPIGANAGLLWPRHLADYQSLDLFSAETDHHAGQQRFSDVPIFAYRMADAVERPYAATASGGDWAYIKEHNLPGLVQGWIALSYAAGHCFMTPHHQWCYTSEKGTHWYDGPKAGFAPLYQFVRQHPELFDDYDTFADVGVVVPHRSFLRNANRWFDLNQKLMDRNITYRIVLGGDEIVDHPLTLKALNANSALLILERGTLLPEDQQLLADRLTGKAVYSEVADLIAAARPSVRVESLTTVRALPRVKRGSAVIHLLNYNYDLKRDSVAPVGPVKVIVETQALGIPGGAACTFSEPGGETRTLLFRDGVVEVPKLGLWGVLWFGKK